MKSAELRPAAVPDTLSKAITQRELIQRFRQRLARTERILTRYA